MTFGDLCYLSLCKLFHHKMFCNIVQGGEKIFKPIKVKVYKPYMYNFAKANIKHTQRAQKYHCQVGKALSGLCMKWQNEMNKSFSDFKPQADETRKQVTQAPRVLKHSLRAPNSLNGQ